MPGRPRSDTRDRLIDAAFDMFVERGYEGTAVTDVERAVGLKPGTGSFYRYFRSKDELLRAAVEREVARCMEDVIRDRAEMVPSLDPVTQISDGARRVLRALRRFDKLFRLVIAEQARVPELQSFFTAALASAEAVGPWMNEADRLVAIAALTGYHVLAHMSPEAPAGVGEEDFIRALTAVLPAGRPPGVPER